MRGRHLREARNRLEMSQVALATLADLSERTVRKAEKDVHVGVRSLTAICAVLRLDLDALPPRVAPQPARGLRVWTAEMDRRVADQWRRGMGTQDIARMFGVTPRAVAARMMRMGVRYEGARRA